ncbi:MAG TPA: hypothetical protein VF139_02275 [Candidatus Polarisedimenticolaceae bacterium]
MAQGPEVGCRVVARFADGRVVKGTIQDFAPGRALFHIQPSEPGAAPMKVPVGALKALFFVKDYEGDPKRKDRVDFDEASGQGRRLIVHFTDGEAIAGITSAFAPDKPGFFMTPADPNTNNERIFVLRSAVRRVEWIVGTPSAATEPR